MKLLVLGDKAEKYKSCQDILRIFFDSQGEEEIVLEIDEEVTSNSLTLDAKIIKFNQELLQGQVTIREEILDPLEIDNQLKRMARLAFYRILLALKGNKPSPWGILTGIRPTKILHRFLDKAWPKEAILRHLTTCYEVEEEKADLLLRIVLLQRKHLLSKEDALKIISIYIGIPFCPTRCAYCSFPAYSLDREGKFLEPFLEALIKEIKAVGSFVRENSLIIQTLYLGGGTPTSLTAGQLEKLLKVIQVELNSAATLEFTVEAGRPDSIDRKKLEVLRNHKVSRISINPQSMNEETLIRIGRNHSPQDVIEKFNLAREVGFNNINMDLILGLPGEDLNMVQKTIAKVKELDPENLTVHTLAIKRASRLKEEGFSSAGGFETNLPKEMLELTMAVAEEMGMHPYYLYRQKQMRGQLENIGYAKPGFDSLYNIQMMEERQTIIGLGAGSASKFIYPEYWTLDSFYNPKDPLNYIERIDELINKKLNMLSTCLGIRNII